MLGKLRAHVRSNAIAYVALFFALGGGAYAATSLAPADSVNSAAIINGQVKSPDLASAAVSASKVAANSLTGAQINESTLGTVPRANLANNAGKLGGSPASAFTRAVTINGNLLGSSQTTVLSTHGLTLKAACHEFPAPSSLSVSATSTSGGRFEISDIRSLNGGTATPILHGYVLQPGQPTTVLSDAFTTTASTQQIEAEGTFAYAPQNGSGAMTATFLYYIQNGGGECDLLGNAVPSS